LNTLKTDNKKQYLFHWWFSGSWKWKSRKQKRSVPYSC